MERVMLTDRFCFRPDHMEHVDALPTGQTVRQTDTSGHPDTIGQMDTTCDPQTPVGPSGNQDLSPPEVTTDTEKTTSMATQGPTHEEPKLAESSPAPVDDKDETTEEGQGTARVNGGTSDTKVAISSAATPEGDDPFNDQSENGRVPRDDVTAHGTPSYPTSGGDVGPAPDTVTKATDNSAQPIHDATNPDTTADDVTKQDGDVPDDIAVTWFRAVISGEVAAVEAILPRITDVNIRDQVMIWEILVLFESFFNDVHNRDFSELKPPSGLLLNDWMFFLAKTSGCMLRKGRVPTPKF